MPKGRLRHIRRLNIVVLYANNAMMRQVLDIYGRAQAAFKEAEVDSEPWLLQVFTEPERRVAASQALARADMVVVNPDHPHVHSKAFRRWAETWPAASISSPSALVVFHHGGSDGPRVASGVSSLRWLQELAGRKGMDFITNQPTRCQRQFSGPC
jgi:CTP:molybdopterin cytidylyltransferase MocA